MTLMSLPTPYWLYSSRCRVGPIGPKSNTRAGRPRLPSGSDDPFNCPRRAANGGGCLAFGARGVPLNPLRRRCRENDMTASDLLDELRESRSDMMRLVGAASWAE